MQPSEMFKKHCSTLFKSVEGRESNVPVDEVEEILKLVRTLLNSIAFQNQVLIDALNARAKLDEKGYARRRISEPCED